MSYSPYSAPLRLLLLFVLVTLSLGDGYGGGHGGGHGGGYGGGGHGSGTACIVKEYKHGACLNGSLKRRILKKIYASIFCLIFW
jgi:hypothetical protein